MRSGRKTRIFLSLLRCNAVIYALFDSIYIILVRTVYVLPLLLERCLLLTAHRSHLLFHHRISHAQKKNKKFERIAQGDDDVHHHNIFTFQSSLSIALSLSRSTNK